MIRYHYAYSDSDTLVCIDEVTEEERATHTYRCIQCGRPMIAKLGKIKEHHFAHASDTACDGETYLHKLAKIKIKKAFYESGLRFSYMQRVKCLETNNCEVYKSTIDLLRQDQKEDHISDCDLQQEIENTCAMPLPYSDDLKNYYDTCEEEKTIYVETKNDKAVIYDTDAEGRNKFIADLYLTHSSGKYNQHPVLIEIHVNNLSSDTKLNSKLRIIEIDVEDEADIERYISEGLNSEQFPDSPICSYHYYSRNEVPKVRFYGFKKYGISEINLGHETITRFVYFHKGSCFVPGNNERVSCKYIHKRYIPYSDIELNVPVDYWEVPSPMHCGLIYLLDKGVPIKNCILCKFYFGYDKTKTPFCSLTKDGLTPQFSKQEFAKTCEHYCINDILAAEVRQKNKTINITEAFNKHK